MPYAGPARDRSETEQAVALAGRVFSPAAENSDLTTKRKRFLVLDHPGAGKDPAIVVSLPDKGVIGAAFLIDRIFPRGPAMIHGTFISSICIDEGVRGLGYSRTLMDAAIDACTARGAAIALVIARRAADHFYTRFGFWGISQYSKLVVDAAALSATPTLGMHLRPATSSDLSACAALRDANYRGSFGHCLRDDQTWRYVLKKVEYLHTHLSVIESERSIVAYAIHDDVGNVYELGSAGAAEARAALTLLAGSSPAPSLLLHVSPSHPAVSALNGLEITLATRECAFGGHMVRVLDPSRLLSLLATRIESHVRCTGLLPCDEMFDGVCMHWNGIAARARLDGPSDAYDTTARLLGVRRISSLGSAPVLDPPVSFNIPLLDQI